MSFVFKLLVGAVCIVICSVSFGQIGVITPQEAKELIEQTGSDQGVASLDTRGGYKVYFRGHIPNAHHINFGTLRGTAHGVPVQYLPDDLTAALLSRAGVDKNRTHLVYATGDVLPNDEILSATMVAYVLEKFGVNDIRVIDGGLAEWQKQGLPTTQEYHGNPPGKLPNKMNKGIGINLDELLERKDKANVVLVDARPHNEFVGEDDIWVRKGHIPGAINFHWARLMEADNTHKFLPLATVKDDLESAGLTPDKEIIVYCGTSREGSLLRFYLAHVAKFPNVRLYEGSWKEYASLKHYPTETKEN